MDERYEVVYVKDNTEYHDLFDDLNVAYGFYSELVGANGITELAMYDLETSKTFSID